MRKIIFHYLAVSALLALSATPAMARHHNEDDNRHRIHQARVIKASPIYETRQVRITEERCRPGHRRRHNGQDGTVVGGILGGAIGNQMANRGHRTEATVAGAIVGGIIGHEVGNNQSRYARGPERCHPVTRYRDEEVVVGYRVKYRYHGEILRTKTRHHPGKFLAVNRHGRPLED